MNLIKSCALIAVVSTVFLAGCQPTMFGMNKEDFNALSPKEREAVIQSYNQRQMEKAKADREAQVEKARNEPLTSLISSVGGALNKAVDKDKRSVPLHKSHSSKCRWEGSKRICESSSSSSSVGFSFN